MDTSKRNWTRKGQLIGKGINGPKAYKPQYQLKRMTWEFHAYDKDFSPSVPHGHSGKYKLDVITGAIIDTSTGLIVTFLDKKELNRLLGDKKFQSFAITARQFYLENNPGAVLPDIGFAKNKNINNRVILGVRYNKISRLNSGVRRTVLSMLNRYTRYRFTTTIKFENK